MRQHLPFLALLGCVLLAGVLLAAPAEAAPQAVRVRTATLPAGLALRVPHIDATTLTDGGSLVSTHYARGAKRSRVVVRDSATGAVRLRFTDYVGLIDARGSRLLLSQEQPARTFVHDLSTGAERTLSRRSVRPRGLGHQVGGRTREPSEHDRREPRGLDEADRLVGAAS